MNLDSVACLSSKPFWSRTKLAASSTRLGNADPTDQIGKITSPRKKQVWRDLAMQSGPGPYHDEVWNNEINRLRRQATSLLSSVKDSETTLRRQYLIILKRSCDKSQANRDQRSLSRIDMEVESAPGEPWFEYPDRSESTGTDYRQGQTVAAGGRVRERLDLQLEIIYLENAYFMHDNRSEEWKSDTVRLDELARFRTRHVEFTGNSEPGHALIPVIPSREDWYVGVTGWLMQHPAQTPLPTRDILDKSCHWQWPEVKLAVYSWAFYDLLHEQCWKSL